MPSKTGPRGVIKAISADGQPVTLSVSWRRGATYISYDGQNHLVHASNRDRPNGFVKEAVLVFHVKEPVYTPY